MHRDRLHWLLIGLAAILIFSSQVYRLVASDHDDGEIDEKGRSLNITDVYFFREDNQSGHRPDRSNAIIILNTHPRSLARQQYYYSSVATYRLHLTRVAEQGDTPTGVEDILFQFNFSEPDGNNRQAITFTAIKDGNSETITQTSSGNSMLTSSLADSTANRRLIQNRFSVDGASFTLFSGPREDPFFFDVEWYFQIRAFALGFGPKPSPLFRSPSRAVDFAAGYNVQSIVLRVPIQYIGSVIADVWASITLPN